MFTKYFAFLNGYKNHAHFQTKSPVFEINQETDSKTPNFKSVKKKV